jgi:hypothetical protein
MAGDKSKKTYEAKVKVLQKNFADMRSGQKMAIGTPQLIASIVKTVPSGTDWSLFDLRRELAKRLKADTACPVTTSMYLRIAIENEVASGRTRFGFPFWRVVSPTSVFFKRLTPKAKATVKLRRSREGLIP